jgi:hypothetical protein
MTLDILNKKLSIEAVHEIRNELKNGNSSLRIEYLLDVEDRANEYLQDRQNLVIVLSQLLPITADCFKSDRLNLTIIKDPENCSLDRFVIVVNTHLSSDMALVKLQELDDRCFRANIPNDILVHVEFI